MRFEVEIKGDAVETAGTGAGLAGPRENGADAASRIVGAAVEALSIEQAFADPLWFLIPLEIGAGISGATFTHDRLGSSSPRRA